MTTPISIAVPTERLERDVRAQLTADEAASVDLFVWPMEEPTDRPHIDVVVPPYLTARAAVPFLADITTTLVQGQMIGWDNIPAILPAGHRFANAATVHETATAELALAMILAAQRDIPTHVRNQDQAHWGRLWSRGLADKRVLLLGYGGVGKAVADRLAPFEVELTVVASSARTEDGVTVHGIDELTSLLPDSDIVVLTLPGNAQTEGLFDATTLALLPDDALVVNVGRGVLVDSDALVAETRSGRLRAALDVTDPEPLLSDHALWSSPGVLIIPHTGGAADPMHKRVAALVTRQIRHLLAGEEPENVVYQS